MDGWKTLVASLVLFGAALSLLIQPLSRAVSQAETGNPRIAFITRNYDTRILTLNLSDPDGANVIPLITNAPNDGIYYPVWSPDGTQLAFSANLDGSMRYNVYIVDSDGSNLRMVSAHPSMQEPSYPAWSPDGTQLLYITKYSGVARYDVYKINADGTGEERLELDSIDVSPLYDSLYGTWIAWSPDGSQIAVHGYDLDSQYGKLYVLDADGSNAQVFPAPDDGLPFSRLAWSPDGERVVLHNIPYGAPEAARIGVANADGSDLQIIMTTPPVNLSSASWSPDGSQIVFIANDPVFEAPGDLWIINPDGSNLHRLNIAGDVAFYFGTSWGLIPEEFVFPSTPISLETLN
jgi:Tol biopolymer transport system component